MNHPLELGLCYWVWETWGRILIVSECGGLYFIYYYFILFLMITYYYFFSVEAIYCEYKKYKVYRPQYSHVYSMLGQ